MAPHERTPLTAEDRAENGSARLARTVKRDVVYDGDNHLSVLLQMHGSVWPEVLPWCLATLLVTYSVYAIKDHVDLTIQNTTGHTFISILVSFLLITRTTITYNRFMEARQHLADLFRSSQEIVQYACVLTRTDARAVHWRQEVAYRSIVTLRMAIAAVEFRSHGINAWDALPDEDHDKTQLILEEHHSVRNFKPSTLLTDLAHGPRTLNDENFRAPIVWAYNLRETIMGTKLNPELFPEHPLHINETLKLQALVSDVVTAVHELKKLITTPFPFPLVQMARTFLFAWVFSLPLVLINDDDSVWEAMAIILFCTYGFLGLEYVNMELDDPFGTDANDFPTQRWAENSFEDIYITIFQTDGMGPATELRKRISTRVARGDALDNYQADISNEQFWKSR